jgi:hypothetical protein
MIHAATGLLERDHDAEETSVFSVGHNRTVLRTPHAEALSKFFFALPGSSMRPRIATISDPVARDSLRDAAAFIGRYPHPVVPRSTCSDFPLLGNRW